MNSFWTTMAFVCGALLLFGCADNDALATKAGTVRDDNGLKLPLVWCPPGRFTMGRPMDGDYESYFSEFQVPVTLTRGFWIGKTEVTQAQWEQIMSTKPWVGRSFSEDVGRSKEGPNFPAVYMKWEEATEFCTKLTEAERAAGRIKANEAYVLPTEAQWEYACRAGTTTRFSFGDDLEQLDNYAWFGAYYNGNTKNEPYAHEVGLKQPNPWGLHDMHGNLYEWCSDYYEDKVVGGKDPRGPKKGSSSRSVRGGSFYGEAINCRSTMRLGWPWPDAESSGWHDIGFRVALVTE
jgi:formylglycine-generating enzyme required for sulfatase activity